MEEKQGNPQLCRSHCLEKLCTEDNHSAYLTSVCQVRERGCQFLRHVAQFDVSERENKDVFPREQMSW